MKPETVIYKKWQDIAVIKLNRPEVLNAQNHQLTKDLWTALNKAGIDHAVRAIVIKGEGRAFCSGHDLKETLTLEEEKAALEELQDISRMIIRMGKPVIAAIHGYALGFGCELAMNCDIRIAAEGTILGFPEVSLGSTVTNAGTKLLPILIGLGRAKELVFTSRRIDAKQAEAWGLVNKVVPLETLNQSALEMAKQIARNNAYSIALSKAALNNGTWENWERVLEEEVRDVILSRYSMEQARSDEKQ